MREELKKGDKDPFETRKIMGRAKGELSADPSRIQKNWRGSFPTSPITFQGKSHSSEEGDANWRTGRKKKNKANSKHTTPDEKRKVV